MLEKNKKFVEKKKAVEKKKVVRIPKKEIFYTATPNKNVLTGRLLTKHVRYTDITKKELDTLKKCKAI